MLNTFLGKKLGVHIMKKFGNYWGRREGFILSFNRKDIVMN